MKKRVRVNGNLVMKCTILLMVMVCGNGYGQLKIKWQNTYPMSSNFTHVINLKNGYLLCGDPYGPGKVTITKLDKNRNFIFTKNIGTGQEDQFISACESSNGTILLNIMPVSGEIGGDRTDTARGLYIRNEPDFWFVLIDSNGNIIWDKTYGGGGHERAYANCISMPNGNFVIGGLSSSNTSYEKSQNSLGGKDGWILKIDKNGNKIWDKTLGTSATDDIKFIKLHKNNLFILCHTNVINSSASQHDLLLIKLDTNGNTIWSKIFPVDGLEIANQILIDSLDNIYLLSSSSSNANGFKSENNRSKLSNPYNFDYWILKLDSNGNKIWDKTYGGNSSDEIKCGLIKNNNEIYLFGSTSSNSSAEKSEELRNIWEAWVVKIDSNGNKIWDKTITACSSSSDYCYPSSVLYENGNFVLSMRSPNCIGSDKNVYGTGWLIEVSDKFKKISGKIYPDFNSNCKYDFNNEYNIKNFLLYNKMENSYTISRDTNFTVYTFDKDTAILSVITLDSNLYVACGKDSIVVDMTGKKDTTGIDFPIRSTKTGSCIKITSMNHSRLVKGRWGDYQLNYQNNAFDTAYNAYIDVEIDTAKIDSITSPYTFTKIGNILRFQIGNVRPFGTSSITYSVKLKTTVIIGSSICHRASVYPRCNLFAHPTQDSSVIELSMICRPNDTIEVQLKNIGTKNQSNWGIVKSYEDIIILYQDTFKLNVGNSRIFKYKLDTNKVYTAEVFNNNGDPINPILIRHDDQCANKKPIIFNNPALQFNRHDEAREYEEDCDIVRGSYDPNMKSVIPVGLFSEHYTSTGTELKYRIDFQNTGTDTAFRVVLVDTLSTDLNIASFVPGVSSHPYSIEFGGRAVKFIFDPIKLVDSFHNEPLSHGFVCFKINHVSGISPKTKIENKADIYFDYNTAVRTNTVFNTIFDTILIYVPKGGGGTGSILGQNQMITDIYPNPASEKVFISLSESVKELNIEMIDMSGRLVQKQISKNDKSVELNVSNLQKGIYILRCMSGDKLVVMKKVEVR